MQPFAVVEDDLSPRLPDRIPRAVVHARDQVLEILALVVGHAQIDRKGRRPYARIFDERRVPAAVALAVAPHLLVGPPEVGVRPERWHRAVDALRQGVHAAVRRLDPEAIRLVGRAVVAVRLAVLVARTGDPGVAHVAREAIGERRRGRSGGSAGRDRDSGAEVRWDGHARRVDVRIGKELVRRPVGVLPDPAAGKRRSVVLDPRLLLKLTGAVDPPEVHAEADTERSFARRDDFIDRLADDVVAIVGGVPDLGAVAQHEAVFESGVDLETGTDRRAEGQAAVERVDALAEVARFENVRRAESGTLVLVLRESRRQGDAADR